MGAPVGNQNATKGRPWSDALRRALARYADDKVKAGEALNHIADTVVKQAVAGDKDARDEIANRMEGRPTQPVSGPDGEALFGPLVAGREELRKKLRG